jgi:excisionase family DNA binding protein
MPADKMRNPKVWITSGEASRRLGVSRLTLERIADEGRITTMKIDGVKARRYKVADVDRLVVAYTTPATLEVGDLLAAQN